MTASLLGDLAAIDKLIVTIVAIALAGLIHAMAHTAAEGSLRPQRIVLRVGANLLVVGAVIFVVRLWTL